MVEMRQQEWKSVCGANFFYSMAFKSDMKFEKFAHTKNNHDNESWKKSNNNEKKVCLQHRYRSDVEFVMLHHTLRYNICSEKKKTKFSLLEFILSARKKNILYVCGTDAKRKYCRRRITTTDQRWITNTHIDREKERRINVYIITSHHIKTFRYVYLQLYREKCKEMSLTQTFAAACEMFLVDDRKRDCMAFSVFPLPMNDSRHSGWDVRTFRYVN